MVLTQVGYSNETHITSVWQQQTTRLQVMVSSIDYAIKHALKQQQVAHPLGYDSIHFWNVVKILESSFNQLYLVPKIIFSEN